MSEQILSFRANLLPTACVVWLLHLLCICSCGAAEIKAQRDALYEMPQAVGSFIDKGTVERIVARDKQHKPGAVVIGITDGDSYDVFGYGTAGTATHGIQKPGERTLFEVASITKLFTGLLLADMAEHGEIQLRDRLQKYLPPITRVQTPSLRNIRLVDLATHTSGIGHGTNVLSGRTISSEKLLQLLPTIDVQQKAPGKFDYNNLGITVLGEALASAAHQPFEPLLKQRVVDVLNLPDTTITLTNGQRARLAQGHSASGSPIEGDIRLACGASGGLKSDVHDLLLFLRAHIYPSTSSLARSINLSLKPYAVVNASTTIALGWFHNRDSDMFYKSALNSGNSAYIAFSAPKHVGVVVLCSCAGINATTIGEKLLAHLLAHSY